MPDDYSPIIGNVAARLTRTGGHVEKVGRAIHGLATGSAPGPTTTAPSPLKPGPHPGTVKLDGLWVAAWIYDPATWARQHGWQGHVTSGYRSVADQREACRHVCGNPNGCPGRCAKPGTSEHQFTEYPRGAIDVSDPTDFANVMRRYPGPHTLRNDLPDDPVHFSHSGH